MMDQENKINLDAIPIEIIQKGSNSICQFILDSIHRKETEKQYRTKIMVVGFEKIGKTSLIDCLFPLNVNILQKGLTRNTHYIGTLQGKLLIKGGKQFWMENSGWTFEDVEESNRLFLQSSNETLELSFPDNHSKKNCLEKIERTIKNSATHGITVQNYQLCSSRFPNLKLEREVNIKASVWDFAGQNEYYHSHHYFLSKRAIFLVVWNMSEGEKGLESLELWLKSISIHLSKTQDQPIPNFSLIVVGTHLDSPNVLKDEMSKRLRADNVRNVAQKYEIELSIPPMELSCSTLEGIEELAQVLFQTALNSSGYTYDISLLAIENALSDLTSELEKKKQPPIVSLPYLTEYCQKFSTLEFDEEKVILTLKRLHIWGSRIYFDQIKELRQSVFLKPEFLTKRFLSQIFSPPSHQFFTNGTLTFRNLMAIWKFDQVTFNEVLHLLELFEAGFICKDSDEVIFPLLLPETPPNELSRFWEEMFPKKKEIERIITFSVLPTEMISRLFVKLCKKQANERIIWRHGLFFTRNKQKILIEATQINQNEYTMDNLLSVTIRGDDPERRKQLMEELMESIHETVKYYPGAILVECVKSRTSLISLERLQTEIDDDLFCPNTKKVLDREELLIRTGIKIPEPPPPPLLTPTKSQLISSSPGTPTTPSSASIDSLMARTEKEKIEKEYPSHFILLPDPEQLKISKKYKLYAMCSFEIHEGEESHYHLSHLSKGKSVDQLHENWQVIGSSLQVAFEHLSIFSNITSIFGIKLLDLGVFKTNLDKNYENLFGGKVNSSQKVAGKDLGVMKKLFGEIHVLIFLFLSFFFLLEI